MTFSYLDVKAGSLIAEHSHEHEQVCHILEGSFQLTINGELTLFEPGTVITIPPNAKHSGLSITDCKLIDVFCPVREDYKNLL
jgi:quercetin dioxygenase-like cupin family protein